MMKATPFILVLLTLVSCATPDRQSIASLVTQADVVAHVEVIKALEGEIDKSGNGTYTTDIRVLEVIRGQFAVTAQEGSPFDGETKLVTRPLSQATYSLLIAAPESIVNNPSVHFPRYRATGISFLKNPVSSRMWTLVNGQEGFVPYSDELIRSIEQLPRTDSSSRADAGIGTVQE